MNSGDLISGKYRLQRLLGSGGMGSVWAARNELTERDFAIKFLLPPLAGNADALHRFFIEARACGRIKHPAVVEVYDVGQADNGAPYLVMELLEGEGLDQRLLRTGRLAPMEAATVIALVARGLHVAHQSGVVHRDLKPGNIFLSVDRLGEAVPKILDFGVSKVTTQQNDHFTTTAGVVLGSPAYMSPEQARGETELDGRSDVWSLGVILYQTLTGSVPFEAPNYNALMVTIMNNPYRPVRELAPDVPAELAAIVDRALAKDRAKRIATASELADLLDDLPGPSQSQRRRSLLGKMPAAIVERAQGASVDSTDAPTRRGFRARRSSAWLVALGAAVLLFAGAGLTLQLRRPRVVVASSASSVFAVVLARMKAYSAEQRADRAAGRLAEPTSQPLRAATPSRAPGTATGKAAPPVLQPNPHGGVESPGF